MYYLYCPYQGPSCNTQWGIKKGSEKKRQRLAIDEIPRQIWFIYCPRDKSTRFESGSSSRSSGSSSRSSGPSSDQML